MSVIQQGAVGLTETSEQSVNFMPDGSAEATMKYRVPWTDIFTYVPTPLQPHPTFPVLLYYDGEVTKEDGNVGNLINRYRGIYQSNPAAFMQVEGTLSTTAEPVELAPVFNGNFISGSYNPDAAPVTRNDISIVENALANNTTPATSVDALLSGPVAIKYYNKKLRGIDSYYRPGFVLRRHYISGEIPEYALDGAGVIGTIVDPDDFLLAGAPDNAIAPVPPEGQNYLFSGVSYRVQGGVVTVDEEFQLSGPGGWDVDLYSLLS